MHALKAVDDLVLSADTGASTAAGFQNGSLGGQQDSDSLRDSSLHQSPVSMSISEDSPGFSDSSSSSLSVSDEPSQDS